MLSPASTTSWTVSPSALRALPRVDGASSRFRRSSDRRPVDRPAVRVLVARDIRPADGGGGDRSGAQDECCGDKWNRGGSQTAPEGEAEHEEDPFRRRQCASARTSGPIGASTAAPTGRSGVSEDWRGGGGCAARGRAWDRG